MPRTYRFFLNKLDNVDIDSGLVTVKDKDLLHQLTKVLRLNNSSPEIVEFLDGSGLVIRSSIQKISDKSSSFKIEEQYQSKRELAINVQFFVPVIKLDAFELMIRKLVELGVQKFVPVAFERSQKQNIAALSSDKSHKRILKIMQEAVEQCEGARLPEITEIIDFADIKAQLRANEYRVFANERLADKYPADSPRLPPNLGPGVSYALDSSSGNDFLGFKNLSLLVGPEGGLNEDEVRSLADENFNPLGLGRRLLKAETAAIALAARLII